MNQQIEEFLADLISMGFTKEKACEKAYEYAIALLAESKEAGTPVTSTTMALAAALVRQSLPGAYRIYEIRNRMH